ncbi:unnamed protein product [Somion occarium]|uniref:F-box domain-containing protein n=1 Tax=Somion occarium TaxID=3059160 RepID=A0ABP1DYD3_9APHY
MDIRAWATETARHAITPANEMEDLDMSPTAVHIFDKRQTTINPESTFSQFPEFPFDVLFEIATWLEPLDLLHLTRISKSFYEVFASKSYMKLWERVNKNVCMLPRCPPHLNNMQFISLLFEDHCQGCGADKNCKTSYALSVRYCDSCWRERIRPGRELIIEFKLGKLDNSIFPLVPRQIPFERVVDLANILPSPSTNTRHHHYLKSQVFQVGQQLKLLTIDSDEYKDYVKSRKKIARDAYKFHMNIQPFARWYQSTREFERKRLIENRERAINIQLRTLGYRKTDFPVHEPSWQRLVLKPQALTDTVWSEIRQELTDVIEQNLNRKREAERQFRLVQVAQGLKTSYEKYWATKMPKEQLPFMPPPGTDLRSIPSIKDALSPEEKLPILKNRFNELLSMIVEHTRNLRECVEDELVADLRAIHDFKTKNDDKVLNSSISLFQCGLNCRPEWSPEFHTYYDFFKHPCALGKTTHWTKRQPVVSHAAVETAKALLDALGIPVDTPWDKLPSKLLCKCDEPSVPRPATFAQMVSHLVAENDRYNEMVNAMPDDLDYLPRLRNEHNLKPEEGEDICVSVVQVTRKSAKMPGKTSKTTAKRTTGLMILAKGTRSRPRA